MDLKKNTSIHQFKGKKKEEVIKTIKRLIEIRKKEIELIKKIYEPLKDDIEIFQGFLKGRECLERISIRVKNNNKRLNKFFNFNLPCEKLPTKIINLCSQG